MTLHILYAENDPIAVELHTALVKEKYGDQIRLHSADSCEEAMDVWHHHNINAVISDCRYPLSQNGRDEEYGGIELYKQITAEDSLAVIYYFSGLPSGYLLEKLGNAKQAGMDQSFCYLKGLPNRFLEVIEAIIGFPHLEAYMDSGPVRRDVPLLNPAPVLTP
jgi:hypothetical protein